MKARRRLGASFHSNEQIRGAPPARARKAVKRGGGHVGTAIDVALWLPDEKVNTVTELDEALGRLEILDARQSRMLELR